MQRGKAVLDITDYLRFYINWLYWNLFLFSISFFKLRMNSTNTFPIFSHADIKQGGKEAEKRGGKLAG